jgi:hypothetical protein
MKKKAAVIKTGASAVIPGAGTEGPRTLAELRNLLGITQANREAGSHT